MITSSHKKPFNKLQFELTILSISFKNWSTFMHITLSNYFSNLKQFFFPLFKYTVSYHATKMKFYPQIHFHHFSNPFQFNWVWWGSRNKKWKWKTRARDRVRKTEKYRMENNFIEMSNAIQENQQSNTVLSSTWTLGTQNSNEKSISNSRNFILLHDALEKANFKSLFLFLFVGTSFRHSACSRYSFKCDFISKKVVKKIVCVCAAGGHDKMKTREEETVFHALVLFDDVKLNVLLFVVSACVKINENSILNNFLRLLVATWKWIFWLFYRKTWWLILVIYAV